MSSLSILVISQKAHLTQRAAASSAPVIAYMQPKNILDMPNGLAAALTQNNLVLIDQDRNRTCAMAEILTQLWQKESSPPIVVVASRGQQADVRPFMAEDHRLSVVTGAYDLNRLHGPQGILSALARASFEISTPGLPLSNDPILIGFAHTEQKRLALAFEKKEEVLTVQESRILARLMDGRMHGNDVITRHMKKLGNNPASPHQLNTLRVHMHSLRKRLKEFIGYDPIFNEPGVAYQWLGPPLKPGQGINRADILAL